MGIKTAKNKTTLFPIGNYQQGGGPPKPNTEQLAELARKQMMDIAASDSYVRRLSNFYSKDELGAVHKSRISNIQNTPIKYIDFSIAPTQARYTYENDLLGQPKNAQIEIYKDSKNKLTTYLHELVHASTMSNKGLSKGEQDYIKSRVKIPKDGDDKGWYLTDGTEVLARKTVVSKWAADEGIIDINSDIDESTFNHIGEVLKSKKDKQSKEVLRYYNELLEATGNNTKNVIDIWNTVAQVNTNNNTFDKAPIAQDGVDASDNTVNYSKPIKNKMETIKPWDGVPNLDVIFERRDGQLIPVFIQNKVGQRLPWGEKPTIDFQYPGGFVNGGTPNTLNISGIPNAQAGGRAGLYGNAGNLLTSLFGDINSSGLFNTKPTPAPGLDGYYEWLKKNNYTGFFDRFFKQEEYTNSVKEQQDFNKMLPLGIQLAGLMDLQMREQDELSNKKMSVQDFPTSNATYAPVGFAQEGGDASINQMQYAQGVQLPPSLKALQDGLPKEMPKKAVKMVVENAIKEDSQILEQILGYKDNSPFNDKPSININSDTITMDGVGKTLVATSDNGIRKILKPNSGTHFFPGAKVVTEVPIAQDGGQPTPNNTNEIIKLLGMNKYMSGGRVTQNYMPVGNEKTKVDSYIPLAAMIPIQTERDELIVLPTGDLTKVNAKKRHSQMSDDEVTDIVPEDSYILSQYGKVDIYKSEADQIQMEVENKPYNLFGSNPTPKVKTLGDIMNKKVMKPADLARLVEQKYKIVNHDDPYTIQTNAINKHRRGGYLQAIIQLSEYDKARKGIDNSIETQLSQNNQQPPQMVASNGGKVMRTGYNVPKAWLGAFIGGIASLVGTGVSAYQNWKARKRADRLMNQQLGDINAYNTDVRRNLGLGLGLGATTTLLQDPTINPAIESDQFISQLPSYVNASNNAVFEGNRNNLYANRTDTSTMTPQMAMLFGERYNAQTMQSQGQLAAQLAAQRANTFAQYLQARQNIFNKNSASRTAATNSTRTNRNNMMSTLGGMGMGYFDNLNNLAGNVLNAKAAARGQNTAAQIQLGNQMAQTINNGLASGLQAYNSYMAAQPKPVPFANNPSLQNPSFTFNPQLPTPPAPTLYPQTGYNLLDTSTWGNTQGTKGYNFNDISTWSKIKFR